MSHFPWFEYAWAISQVEYSISFWWRTLSVALEVGLKFLSYIVKACLYPQLSWWCPIHPMAQQSIVPFVIVNGTDFLLQKPIFHKPCSGLKGHKEFSHTHTYLLCFLWGDLVGWGWQMALYFPTQPSYCGYKSPIGKHTHTHTRTHTHPYTYTHTQTYRDTHKHFL